MKPEDKNVMPFLASWQAQGLLVMVCFFLGCAYVVAQWVVRDQILDTLFVSMLIAASFVLAYGITLIREFLATKGIDFFNFIASSSDPKAALSEHAMLLSNIFNLRGCAVFGLVYGLTIASSVFMFGLWVNQQLIQISLFAFLFSVNFLTGIAFYSLIRFFIYANRLGSSIEVDLWMTNNPSTEFLLGASRRIALIASIYVCLAQLSILFSLYEMSELVVFYAAFACSVILLSLILPALPVVRKLADAKTATLRELDKKINQEFFTQIDASDKPGNVPELATLESLLTLRRKVDSQNVLPFKAKSLMAGISVVFFSAVPVVIQVFLERYFS